MSNILSNTKHKKSADFLNRLLNTPATYHDYMDKTAEETNTNTVFEKIYEQLGYTFVRNTDKATQETGIDYYLTDKKTGQTFTVDNKLTKKNFKHQTHMLLEHSSVWNSSGKLYQIGWARDPKKVNDFLLDYCSETKEFFLYRMKDLVQVFDLVCKDDITEYPAWTSKSDEVYVPRSAPNKYMQTHNVFFPRERYLKNCLINKGSV